MKLNNTILKRTQLILIALVLLSAMSYALFFLSTPVLNHYKPVIQDKIGQFIGFPVEMKTVKAGWYWWHPKIELNEVTIFDPTKKIQIARLKRLEISISLWQSLWHQKWQSASIRGEGADIIIEEAKPGKWRIAQANSKQVSGQFYDITQETISWIAHQEHINLRNFNVLWHRANGELLPISHLQVKISNKHHNHKFNIKAQLAQLVPSRLEVKGVILRHGPHLDDWEGHMSIHAKNILLKQWLGNIKFAGLTINNGKLNGRFKFAFRGRHFQQFKGDLDLQDVNFVVTGTKHTRLLQRFRGHFSGMHNDAHWQIRSSNSQLKVLGKFWPVNKMYLAWEDNEDAFVYAKAHYLSMTPFMTLVRHNPNLSPEAHEVLMKLNPRGELINLDLSYSFANHHWTFATEFKNIKAEPWEDWPGVENMSGSISASTKSGQLHLRCHHAKLKSPRWLRKELPIESLVSDTKWYLSDDGWHVDTEKMLFKTHNVDLKSEFVWRKITKESSGNLD